mgnify:CR=1 FL=1
MRAGMMKNETNKNTWYETRLSLQLMNSIPQFRESDISHTTKEVFLVR